MKIEKVNVFDELVVTVATIGINKTIERLQEARLINKDVDIIINAVEIATGIKKKRILKGTDRSDERKMALALCIYYIKTYCQYSFLDIAKIFNRDVAGLYRYSKIVENLPNNPITTFDKELSGYCIKINSIIKN
jgi:chromosomal replication initiation ATPase DnaA